MNALDHPSPVASPRLASTFKQAVTLGIESVVRHHLESGQDVNSRDDKGQTPLIIAATRGHTRICSILLNAGANPDLKNFSGFTALDMAISQKHSEISDLLQKFSRKAPLSSNRLQPAGDPSRFCLPPEAMPVAATTSGEENCEFDLSGWQPEVAPPPPPQNPAVLSDARTIQQNLGQHVPVDLDEDWSDVAIALPESIARRRSDRNNEEEARWLADASMLVLTALRQGQVPESLIEEISPIKETGRGSEGEVDYGRILYTALGDLGVRIEDDESCRTIFEDVEDKKEDPFDLELSEVMEFLRTCLKRKEEPLTHYLKALANTKMLSRDDEQAIGRVMEEGISLALTAITSSTIARDAILDTLDHVERHEIAWDLVIAEDPEYMDENLLSDDEHYDIPEEAGENAVVNEIRLPKVLEDRINSVREACAAFHDTTSQDISARTQKLGHFIQQLGLRRKFLGHLVNKIVRNPETNQNVREQLSAGLKKSEDAKNKLFFSNQKLVFWLAKKYLNRGLPLMDLVQEGSLGLMKAVERFDYTRGVKFSTYAVWWIRQSITRAIADQSRLIRVPVHMAELINKVRRIRGTYEIRQDREPTVTELATLLETSESKIVRALFLLQDTVVEIDGTDDARKKSVVESLFDPSPSPEEKSLQKEREAIIAKELARLPRRSRDVICRRFGIGRESDQTLEEVGQVYHVTRERIRQIEAKALRRLKHPAHSRKLQALL